MATGFSPSATVTQSGTATVTTTASSPTTASAFSCCPANGESSSIGEDSIELSDSQGNNNTMYHNGFFEKEDYHFPKRPTVDIEFRDIRYTVKKINFGKAKIGEYLHKFI